MKRLIYGGRFSNGDLDLRLHRRISSDVASKVVVIGVDLSDVSNLKSHLGYVPDEALYTHETLCYLLDRHLYEISQRSDAPTMDFWRGTPGTGKKVGKLQYNFEHTGSFIGVEKSSNQSVSLSRLVTFSDERGRPVHNVVFDARNGGKMLRNNRKTKHKIDAARFMTRGRGEISYAPIITRGVFERNLGLVQDFLRRYHANLVVVIPRGIRDIEKMIDEALNLPDVVRRSKGS